MEERIRVGDIMTRNFTFVHPEDSLEKCAKTMIKKRIGSLIVKENDQLKGVISKHDIIWALYKKKFKNMNEIKVKDIATKKLVTVKPDASIREAISRMNKKKIRRLPVISNKKMIGYITAKDILRISPSLFESLSEYDKIREESDKIRRSEAAMQEDYIEEPCEGCGNFDILEKYEGRMLCEACIN